MNTINDKKLFQSLLIPKLYNKSNILTSDLKQGRVL